MPVATALLVVITCARSEADKPLPKEIDKPAQKDGAPKASYTSESLRGRVVWLADALKRRHGIGTVADAAEHVLALETADGHLHPIIEDVRGRAFRIDKRLRDMDVELTVRRYRDPAMIQVVRVYSHKEDGKYQLDYWCDICAIVMFELGPCDCCQEPNRLREQKVD